MHQKVQKYIEELHMISPGELLLVGVSGGADSVALLKVLHTLYAHTDVALEAVHVEHGIRGAESVADAIFVRNLCADIGVPCHIASVNVPEYAREHGLGLEEAARILRYEVFASLAKSKTAKVVLAHHMEDNAETILFQMVRGSALSGLCGIKPIRRDEDGITYIRPFLKVHRTEIEAYLQQQEQSYCVDSTNFELDYSRNQLRQNVLPELNKINEKAIDHMSETADMLSEIKVFVELEVQKKWDTCVKCREQGLYLDVEQVVALPDILQKEIVYRAITKIVGSKKDIGAVHVKSVLDLCQSQSGKSVHLPYQMRARREYEAICIFLQNDKESVKMENAEYIISEEQLKHCCRTGEVLTIPFGQTGEKISLCVFPRGENYREFSTNPYTKWLDYDKIKQGFCIRTRQSGDYFISDVFGHRKSLRRYFIDEKIPAGMRDSMWLVAQENTVLWLIGGRISEHVKLSDDTNLIVELKYQGGQENEC